MSTNRPTIEAPQDARKRRRVAVATEHVIEKLRRRIIESGLPPGSQFASRRVIAEEFGVSLGTVQQAVSQLVTEGFLEARGNMGTVIGVTGAPTPTSDTYRITPTARGYIGIVAHIRPKYDSDNPHWQHTIVSAIEREAADLGHPTLFCNLYRGPDDNMTGVDGLSQAIVMGAESVVGVMIDRDVEAVQSACRAAWSSRPVVFAVSQPMRLPAIHCGYDATADGYRAAQHLIDAGCRRLLCFSPSGKAWAVDRAKGAQIALEHNPETGATIDTFIEEFEFHGSIGLASEVAERQAERLLLAESGYDGIIAANDSFAYGWMDAAERRGLRLGQDYAIIGFDDLAESQARGLTTLRPPIEGIGIQCARLAVAALRREEHPSSVTLRSHLVTRSSTRLH